VADQVTPNMTPNHAHAPTINQGLVEGTATAYGFTERRTPAAWKAKSQISPNLARENRDHIQSPQNESFTTPQGTRFHLA
jgi:hypothetical protein